MAAHLLDAAAVAAEHGEDELADMLHAEADVLRIGNFEQLELHLRAAQAKLKSEVLRERTVENLGQLRQIVTISREARARRVRARVQTDDIVSDAWLQEGYPAAI